MCAVPSQSLKLYLNILEKQKKKDLKKSIQKMRKVLVYFFIQSDSHNRWVERDGEEVVKMLDLAAALCFPHLTSHHNQSAAVYIQQHQPLAEALSLPSSHVHVSAGKRAHKVQFLFYLLTYDGDACILFVFALLTLSRLSAVVHLCFTTKLD